MTEPVLVSACLLGVRCRYDQQSKPIDLGEAGQRLGLKNARVLPVCPEVLAGFGVPRPAIERRSDGTVRVVETDQDVTEALSQACDQVVALVTRHGVSRAVLKQGSPSCGSRLTWIDGQKTVGEGLLTERLRAINVAVMGEDHEEAA